MTDRLTNEDLRQLGRYGHKHDEHCWGRYETCGEHHRHDDHCGSRSLICGRREDQTLARLVAGAIAEICERRACDLSDAEAVALEYARTTVKYRHNVASAPEQCVAESALAVIDKIVDAR